MKVSFILPAFKGRFLKEAITSILDQTYDNIELVVVDDCSPDNLEQIVCELSDQSPRLRSMKENGSFRYYRNNTNIGRGNLVKAWSRAMLYATGDWCCLASDDDVYMPRYTEEMVRLTEKYPKVDIVHCRNCCIDSSGRITSIGGPRDEFENGIQMMFSSSVLRIHQRQADLMFRKSAYDRFGFPAYPVAWYSDHMMAIRYAWENGSACSPDILFKFRMSGDNISSTPGDVAAKSAAALMFLDDSNKLLKTARPQNETDEILFAAIGWHLESTVCDELVWLYNQLPRKQFVKILHSVNLTGNIKNWLFQQRTKDKKFMKIRRHIPVCLGGWKC